MDKILQSKEYKVVEHAVVVGIFVGLSALLTELINQDFASLLSHHLPSLVSVALINVGLAAGKKYVDSKKNEVIEQKAV